MSVNKDRPHVMVLPEDDANRQIANGFWQSLDFGRQRQLQVLAPSGGWLKVVSEFESYHIAALEKIPARHLVLVIDLDDDPERAASIRAKVPPSVADRVFVLGCWSEPERLKAALAGSYEDIGAAMAEDCRARTMKIWNHSLLACNQAELERLQNRVNPILF